jgi:MYXO-CTERM domain-containing protein
MEKVRLGLAISLVVAGVAAGARSARAFECDSNLMIVLDRSCSMDNVPAGETRTKWEIAVDALATLTTDYQGELRFGLIMFPDQTGESCAQDGEIYVPVGPDQEAAVMAAVGGTQPTGPCVTNIDTAMAQVFDDPVYDPAPVDPPVRRSFVLLLTDGKQSSACGGEDRDPVTEQTIADLYAAGYPTYVVGFGDGVRPASLATFATAGGVPRVGDPVYFQADTAADLDQALAVIAGSVVGDPEFGCPGLPCPDGRCSGAYEQCVDGTCLPFYPDAGPTPAVDAGAGDGDGGGGDDGGGGLADGEGVGGCGCRTGGASGGAWLGLALLALAARRRRA